MIDNICMTFRTMPRFRQQQHQGGADAAEILRNSPPSYRKAANSLQSQGEEVAFRLAQDLTKIVSGLYFFPTGRLVQWMSISVRDYFLAVAAISRPGRWAQLSANSCCRIDNMTTVKNRGRLRAGLRKANSRGGIRWLATRGQG